MRVRDLPGYLRDTALRLLPHRARTGLISIGAAGPDDPVLATCNFTLTVRRLRDVLEGRRAWVLVCDSRGINVWCAAGGGHLTHHDVIAAIRTSGVQDLVSHRTLVLPQLAATGVERKTIQETTGWTCKWGPARLEDLPAFLDRDLRVSKPERRMRSPLWERLEMAAMWFLSMAPIVGIICGLLGGWRIGLLTGGLVVSLVASVFALLPSLRVKGRAAILTYGAFALVGAGVGAQILLLFREPTALHLGLVTAASFVSMGVLSIDLAGSTPTYPSSINSFRNHPKLELLEDACTGRADCVLVCPTGTLEMDGPRRKVKIAHQDHCIVCGACIVQCPEDALQLRYPDGRVVAPATIRRTRLNMLGRRTVEVR